MNNLGCSQDSLLFIRDRSFWGRGRKEGQRFKSTEAGPVAQAGSNESSNRLRRFRGSKVGQGPLGGSESMSVRSRASLRGGKKKK